MSVPTTTQMMDQFVERYSAFRAELPPEERLCFDELVCRARSHSNAVNRRPHMDFERPVLLSMLVAGHLELQSTRAELQAACRQLEEVCQALGDKGLVRRRMPRPSAAELARVGQVRLG